MMRKLTDSLTDVLDGPDRDSVWDLGELPFHIGARTRPTNMPLPNRLPMRVGVDRDTGVLVQVADPAVERALSRAYTEGSQIGTPLSVAGAGWPALEDFRAFVLEARGDRGLVGARTLEIGCGTGAPLAQIVSAVHMGSALSLAWPRRS